MVRFVRPALEFEAIYINMEAEKPFVVATPVKFPEKGDVVVYYNDSECKLIRASPRSSTCGGLVQMQKNNGVPGKNRGDPEQNKTTSSNSFSAFSIESSTRKTISRNTCCLVVLTVLTIVSLCIAVASLTLTVLLLLQVIPIQDLSRVSPTAAPSANGTASKSTSSGATAAPYLPSPCNCSCNCTAELQQVFQVQERLNISVEQIENLLAMFDMLNISLSILATDFRAVNSTVASLQSTSASDSSKINTSSILANLSIPADLHGVEAYSNCSTVKAASCSIPSSIYAGSIPSFKYCKTDEVPMLAPNLYNLDVTCTVEESTSLAPIVATLEVSENTGNMRCLCYVVVASTSALGPSNLGCNMYIKRCPSSETLQVTINTN